MNCGLSAACLAVNANADGQHLRSAARWTRLVRPPREPPNRAVFRRSYHRPNPSPFLPLEERGLLRPPARRLPAGAEIRSPLGFASTGQKPSICRGEPVHVEAAAVSDEGGGEQGEGIRSGPPPSGESADQISDAHAAAS
jgi:hypothetical protein